MSNGTRRPMVISPRWLQATVLTFVVGFAILGYLALRVYEDHAPVPHRVVSENGAEIFTHEDILQGQVAFLTYGLMEYGSIYGHGAYLGPDFTADYLHREALLMRDFYGGGAEADQRVKRELQANRYDPATGTLTWSGGQIQAFEALLQHYEQEILNRPHSGAGIGPHAVASPNEVRQITAFIAWTAWTASARRPDRPYSYTNNWPPEPLAGNDLTGDVLFIAGVVPLVYLTALALIRPAERQAPADATGTALQSPLFTEVAPSGAAR